MRLGEGVGPGAATGATGSAAGAVVDDDDFVVGLRGDDFLRIEDGGPHSVVDEGGTIDGATAPDIDYAPSASAPPYVDADGDAGSA